MDDRKCNDDRLTIMNLSQISGALVHRGDDLCDNTMKWIGLQSTKEKVLQRKGAARRSRVMDMETRDTRGWRKVRS